MDIQSKSIRLLQGRIVESSTGNAFHPSPQLMSTFRGHKDFVMSVSFSPDQKKLCSVGDDLNVVLWDLESMGIMKTFEDGHEDRIYSVDYSPKGKYFATGSGDTSIKLWDDESSAKSTTKIGEHESDVNCVRFLNNNSNFILSCGDDEKVKLWNIECQKLLRMCESDEEYGGVVTSIDVSKDDLTLISGNYLSTQIWDLRSLKCSQMIIKNDKVECVQFCPNSPYYACGDSKGCVELFDIRSCKCLYSLEYSTTVQTISFHPSGTYMISSSGSEISLFNLSTKKEVSILKKHQSTIFSIRFSPDGKFFASGGVDNHVLFWNSNVLYNRDKELIAKKDEEERRMYLIDKFQNDTSSCCDIFTLSIANRMNSSICISKIFFFHLD